MNKFSLPLAALLMTVLGTATSNAAGLQPLQSQKVELGQVLGDAYYTAGPLGYDVVATFAPRSGVATPLRVEAMLKPGQTVVFSTPGDVGTPAQTVSLTRRNDTIEVHAAPSRD